MNFTSTMLQLILIELADTALSAEFTTRLTQSVRTAYTAFDQQLVHLRHSSFRRLPFNQSFSPIPANLSPFRQRLTSVTKFPLPWYTLFTPSCQSAEDGEAQIHWGETPREQMAILFSAISLQLTQFYLYLMHTRNQPLKTFAMKRCKPIATPTLAKYMENGNSPDPHLLSLVDETDNLTKNSKELSSMRNLFTANSNSSSPIKNSSDVSTCFPENCLPEGGLVTEEDKVDRDTHLCSLAQTLTTVTECFLVAPSPLRTVFTCNVSHLIAVAEHSNLRRSLAAWFQSLVEETYINTATV